MKQPRSARRGGLPILRTLGRDGAPWSRTDTLTALTLLTTLLVGVATIVVMYVDVRETRRSNQIAQAPAPTVAPASDLRVVRAEIRRLKDISTEFYKAGSETRSVGKTAGPAIDVTLQNTGTQPALITEAELRFLKAEQLQPCFGSGDLEISARYDVKVPVDADRKPLPLVLRHPTSFQVKENAYDRLAFTVGPEIRYDGGLPWIYQAELTVVEDSGRRLPAGRFTLMAPHANQSVFGDPTYNAEACIRDNGLRVARAVGAGGKVDPELVTLHDAFKAGVTSATTSPPSSPTTNATPSAAAVTPSADGCIQDETGDVPQGGLDITAFCADYRVDRLRLRIAAGSALDRARANGVEVRVRLPDGKEYVVQSSPAAARAESACVARSIPTPSDPDCVGASAAWAGNQVVIDITRRHPFMRQPKLRLSLSLYSANLSNAEADNAPEGLPGMLVTRRA